jgi:hypothetical protein
MGDGNKVPSASSPNQFSGKESPSVTDSFSNSTTSDVQQQDSVNTTVTSRDQSELEMYTTQYNNTDVAGIDNAPSPREFAQQAFTAGVQARRITEGFDGHAATIDDTNRVVGGWNSFTVDDVQNRVQLNDAESSDSSSSFTMTVAELTSTPGRATDTAYVTEYTSEENGVDIEHAHSQMATYASLDAMGVRTPRHALDTESKHVFVENVTRDGYDGEVANPEVLPSEYADRVDPDQFKDVIASNLIVGNYDLKGENIIVGEDGNVTTFDYDQVLKADDLEQFVDRLAAGGITDAVESINTARSDDVDPIEMSTEDVVERTRELATQLRDSGMGDRVASVAGDYDEFFENEDSDAYGSADYIRSAEQRIQMHVNEWSK